MHTGPCPRRKPWPASRSMIGKAVQRPHGQPAVFQPRACRHLTSRLPLEDSAAGTARRASRGCRQVFGLVGVKRATSGSNEWNGSVCPASFAVHPKPVAASPGPSLPRWPLASQCIDGFVPNYRCGAVLEWPWRASPASLFILPAKGWQEPTTTRYGAGVTTATPDVGHKLWTTRPAPCPARPAAHLPQPHPGQGAKCGKTCFNAGPHGGCQ